MNPMHPQSMHLAPAQALERVATAISRSGVVAREKTVRQLVIALACGGHVLLEDRPGTGKTTLARRFAQALDLDFARITGRPDMLPSEVSGIHVYNQRSGAFDWRPGPLFANVVLVDETNRMPPRAQAAFLEPMQEGQATVEGETYPLPRPWLLLATQNPIEYEGTYPLPEAELDRFLLLVDLPPLTAAEHRALLHSWVPEAQVVGGSEDAVTAVLDAGQIVALRRRVMQVFASEAIEDYVARLAEATNDEAGDRGAPGRRRVEIGLSNRGEVALLHAARALALFSDRTEVLPDDVRTAWPWVVPHRLILTDAGRGLAASERSTQRAIAAAILEQVPVPNWPGLAGARPRAAVPAAGR
jgi:MoxR-like ATPase